MSALTTVHRDINYNTERNIARVQISDTTLAQKPSNCLNRRKKCLPKPIELQNQHCQLEQIKFRLPGDTITV